MRSTNTIVQHALEGAKVGGNFRHVTRTEKPKRKAANARPPSNPARNKGGRLVAAFAALVIGATLFAEDAPLHQPNGWSKGATAPMAYVSWQGVGTIIKLGPNGLIDLDSMDDDWREQMHSSPDALTAFTAMQSALQAKHEIEVLPPLDTDATVQVVNGDVVEIADISAAYRSLADAADNRAFCAKTINQCGLGICSICCVWSFLKFANSRTGGTVPAADFKDLLKSTIGVGCTNAVAGWTTGKCLKSYLAENPGMRHLYFLAKSAPNGSGAKDPGVVCALTKLLVAKFGGFIASLRATPDWYLLLPDFRPLLEGRESTITGMSRKVLGNHCILVFAYDNDFVYVQNSWGESWGDSGCARITWSAFSRDFLTAEVVTTEDEASHVLDGMRTLHRFEFHGLGDL